MEYLEDLRAKLVEDGFHFEPNLDDGWHKIKEPIRGSYATRRFPNGVVMTIQSWDGDYKKVYRCFDNNNLNGEAGEVDEFVKKQTEEAKRIKEEANAKAALEAETIWNDSVDGRPEDIPYLVTKRLNNTFGARTDRDTRASLKIPCRDISGKIWGIQTIYASGDKKFIKGQRKEGTFFLVGGDLGSENTGDKKILYIAEGFATAASVHIATQKPVVTAFDAGNLKRVARAFRDKYPRLTIIIAGDNDEKLTGQKAAESAAKEVNGHFFYPNTIGKDWNDCLIEKGEEYIKDVFKEFEAKIPKEKQKFNDAFNVVRASDRRGLVVREPQWLVEQLFAKESISILSADPKAGKSTFTRFLAKCLLDGDDFLGFKCKKSRVLMIAVEEKERFIINNMEKDKLNLQNWEDFYYHVAITPSDAVKKAEEEIIKCTPDLVIFDTMFKILQPEDENSYAQTTKVISKIQNLATWHKIHILSVHHNNKGSASGFNKILGSNGIRGAFDYNIVLDTDAKEMEQDPSSATRFIMSEGREGHFFKKTSLGFNPTTKVFNLGASFAAHQHKQSEEQVLEDLSKLTSIMTKTQWMGQMLGMGQKQKRLPFFEKLVEEKRLIPDKKLWKWNREILPGDKY